MATKGRAVTQVADRLHVYRRPGSPHWQIEYTDSTGGRHRKTAGTHSIATAQRRARIVSEHVEAALAHSDTFATMADAYLAAAPRRLSPSTLRTRRSHLERLARWLGAERVTTLTTARLLRFYHDELRPAVRTQKTANQYLYSLGAVLHHAREQGIEFDDPIPALRAAIRKRGSTKRDRAEHDASAHIRPLELADLAELVEAARADSLESLCHVLLMADAGLRASESIGLVWGNVIWGLDADDRRRHLWIDRARPQDREPEPPKSGRARKVDMSRRLRAALLALRDARGHPGPEVEVLGWTHDRWSRAAWPAICEAAGVKARPKDLRDTFASQLLTAGVQLGYISVQLGHSTPLTTVQHYARWCAMDEYREPVRLAAGELPADLLARFAESRFAEQRATA